MNLRVAAGRRILLVLTVLMAAVFGTHTPARAEGATYYVALSGSDSNPGTQAQPLGTITRAVQAVNPGDTVYVRAGTYDERVVIANSGRSDARITIASQSGATATVTQGFEVRRSRYVTIRGFHVTAAPAEGGFLVNEGSYSEIVDCEVRGNGAGFVNQPGETTDSAHNVFDRVVGVDLPRPALLIKRYHLSSWPPEKAFESRFVTVRNSEFAYSAQTGGNNAGITGSDLVIEGNDFHHNGLPASEDVIQANLERSVFRNNRIHDIQKTPQHNDLLQMGGAVGNVIEGNTFFRGSAGQGLFMSATGGDIRENSIQNNVFFDIAGALKIKGSASYRADRNRIRNNTFYGVDVTLKGDDLSRGAPTNTLISGNIFCNGGIAYAYGVAPGDATSDWNLFSGSRSAGEGPNSKSMMDPMFRDSSLGDFRLRPGSPAIDGGTSDGAPTTDKDGNARYDDPDTPNTGGGSVPYYDVGAYEWVPTETPQLPDVTPPVTTVSVSLESPNGEDGWYASVPTITLSANETATVRAQWDSTSPAGWTENPGTLTAPQGSHTLYYYATDGAGNEEVTKSRAFKVDTTAPAAPSVASATHPGQSTTYSNNDPGFTWSAADSASGVNAYTYVLDQAPLTVPPTSGATADVSATYADLADGTSYFHVRARDAAGNWGNPAHYRVNVDTTGPQAPSGLAVMPGDTQVTLSWVNPTDDFAATRILRSTTGFAASAHPGAAQTMSYEGTAAGQTDTGLTNDVTYYYTAFARDEVGNWSEGFSVLTKPAAAGTPDVEAPTTTVNASPAASDGESGWYRSAPAIALAIGEPAILRVQWDSTGIAGWISNPGTFTAPEGGHTLYYYAADGAGNVEQTKSRQFKVDTQAPIDPTTVSVSHAVGGWSSNRIVKVLLSGAFDSASGVAGYSISWSKDQPILPDAVMDLSADATSASSALLTEGKWYFNLRTKDIAGNWTSTANFGPINIDTISPAAPTGLTARAGNAAVDLAWRNPGSDFAAIRVVRSTSGFPTTAATGPAQGVLYNGPASSLRDRGLVNGRRYYYAVFARDRAGNWSSRAAVTMASPHAPSKLSLMGSASAVGYSQVVRLSGKLSSASSGVGVLANVVPVRIQERVAGKTTWRNRASLYTNTTGVFTSIVRPVQNVAYRVVWSGQGAYAGTTGSAVSVRVRQRVSLSRSAPAVRRGRTLTLRGAVAPAKRLRSLSVLTKVGRAWRRIGSVKTNRYSRFVWSKRLWARGTRYFRVTSPADGLNLAGYTRGVLCRVR